MAFSDRSRILQITDRLYLRMRHRDAWSSATTSPLAPGSGLETLRGQKYCLLTTFRRNGDPVPTPVWFGVANGRLYLHTEAAAGKVKRIATNPRVRVAPSDARGKPLGPPLEADARVLAAGEEEPAERAIAANYGPMRKVYELVNGLISRAEGVYVEVVPLAVGDSPPAASADQPAQATSAPPAGGQATVPAGGPDARPSASPASAGDRPS